MDEMDIIKRGLSYSQDPELAKYMLKFMDLPEVPWEERSEEEQSFISLFKYNALGFKNHCFEIIADVDAPERKLIEKFRTLMQRILGPSVDLSVYPFSSNPRMWWPPSSRVRD